MKIFYVKGNSIYDDPINYEKITNKLAGKFPEAKSICTHTYTDEDTLYYIKDGYQVSTANKSEDFYDVILQIGTEITLDTPNSKLESYIRRVQVLELQNTELKRDLESTRQLMVKLDNQISDNCEEISKLNSEIEKLKANGNN